MLSSDFSSTFFGSHFELLSTGSAEEPRFGMPSRILWFLWRTRQSDRCKDANDPLHIVFVCAMWMTGFDVPSLSTIYLDKPMRNHTLMQTIARANRVFLDKANGLIVDYVGVFRNLQKALAIYGTGSGGGIQEGDTPVQDKSELVALLKQTIVETVLFCQEQGIDPQAIAKAPNRSFERLRLLDESEDALVANDETKRKYLSLARNVAKLYKAILPYSSANTYTALVDIFAVLAVRIRILTQASDISDVMLDIERLVGSSVRTKDYIIRESGSYNTDRQIDLSKIDFEALRAKFEEAHKHTEIERLRGAINSKLKRMVALNKGRTNYQEKFQQLIDEYNAGSMNTDILFEKLIAFTQELNAEERRTIAEQLSEEELAVFDLLMRPDIQLSDAEKDQVKKVTRGLLAALKQEKLVLDWRKKQQTRASVLLTVQEMFDKGLPASYTQEMYRQKCELVFQHIYDSYYGAGRSVYTAAS